MVSLHLLIPPVILLLFTAQIVHSTGTYPQRGDGIGPSASRSSRSSPEDGADGHSHYGGSRRGPYSQSSPPGGYGHYHSGYGIRPRHSAPGSSPLYSGNLNLPASGADSASGRSHASVASSAYSGGYGDKTRPQTPFTATYVTPYATPFMPQLYPSPFSTSFWPPYSDPFSASSLQQSQLYSSSQSQSTLLGTDNRGGQPGYGSRGSALRRRGRFGNGPEPVSMAPQTKGGGYGPGGGRASTPRRSGAYSENDERLTIHSGDYHNSRNVGECCSLIQELLDLATQAIQMMVQLWTGNPRLIREILTQATTAYSTIYNSLSLCKSKLLKFDPTSEMALSVYKGLHLSEESLPKSEKKLKVSSLLQYGDMVSSISHMTAESTKTLSLSSRIDALTFMDQICFEFFLSICRKSLISILNAKTRVLALEIEKSQLALDVYTVNSGLTESSQTLYDRYVLGLPTDYPKESDDKKDE
ncbi:signal peptide-containing protein [Cryptosporidium canis]|nr:signal peptide-containing protein [Cryptosporidium canis]